MFQELTESIRDDFVRYIYRVEFVRPEAQQAQQPTRVAGQPRRGRERQGRAETANANQAVSDKTPRNAPCPCGSGKKYKKCHGAASERRLLALRAMSDPPNGSRKLRERVLAAKEFL